LGMKKFNRAYTMMCFTCYIAIDHVFCHKFVI
jgi:hypothetical protein